MILVNIRESTLGNSLCLYTMTFDSFLQLREELRKKTFMRTDRSLEELLMNQKSENTGLEARTEIARD